MEVDAAILAETRAHLVALLRAFREGRPWFARLAPDMIDYAGDYDQLSRRGEWDDTDRARPIPVGP